MKAGPSERNQKGLGSESGKGVKLIFIVLLLVVLYSSLIFNLIYTFFIFCNFHFLQLLLSIVPRIPDALLGSYRELLAVQRSGCP